MAESETGKTRGRQKGQKFAATSEVFMAAIDGAEALRKLADTKSFSLSGLQAAKEMLAKAKAKVPPELDKLIEAKFRSTGTGPSEPHKIGEVIERVISENRGSKPVLFQIPLEMYSVKDGDHAVIKFHKDKIVIMFRELMSAKDKAEMMPG